MAFGCPVKDKALCANDDETKTCREFTLEILWGVRRG